MYIGLIARYQLFYISIAKINKFKNLLSGEIYQKPYFINENTFMMNFSQI